MQKTKKGNCGWCGASDVEVKFSPRDNVDLCVENCWCPDEDNLMAPSLVVITR